MELFRNISKSHHNSMSYNIPKGGFGTYRNKNPNKHKISLKRIIFPSIPDHKLSRLEIDDESIKFITYASNAREIISIIANSITDFPCPKNISPDVWARTVPIERMKKLVITDITAGVGGNVLSFASHFKYVNAMEIDITRYNYLCNNIDVYGYSNVNCYNVDSTYAMIECDDIAQNIIFFDPPWGGSNYKYQELLKLDFGDYSIETVIRILFQRPCNKLIIVKLPNNYDFEYLISELEDYKVECVKLERMVIVVIKNY